MGRMEFIVLSGDYFFSHDKEYGLKVGEYADVCEGETLTERTVLCENATKILGYHLKRDKKYIMEQVRARLKERFASLDEFTAYCGKRHIVYEELPLWVDTVSFNEYTGEHRGNFAPFGKVGKHDE